MMKEKLHVSSPLIGKFMEAEFKMFCCIFIVIFSFGTDNSKTASILKSVIDSHLNDSQQILAYGITSQ